MMKQPKQYKPRILSLDIERAPSLGTFWDQGKQYVSADQMLEESYVLTWQAKWQHGSWHHGNLNTEGHAKMIRRIHALIGKADIGTPEGFKAAYAQYVAGGWPALNASPDEGGQGLPIIVNQCLYEMLNSANQAWTMYPGLSHGAHSALLAHGTDAQKKTYLPKLVTGE